VDEYATTAALSVCGSTHSRHTTTNRSDCLALLDRLTASQPVTASDLLSDYDVVHLDALSAQLLQSLHQTDRQTDRPGFRSFVNRACHGARVWSGRHLHCSICILCANLLTSRSRFILHQRRLYRTRTC